MTLYLNTNSVVSPRQEHISSNCKAINNPTTTTFQANEQSCIRSSTAGSKNNLNTTKITLGMILGIGLLFGADFVFNHGKISKSIRNKIHSPMQVSENYVDNIEQIQQHFSKIFGKNFSKEKANEMALKYKSIMKENDINILSEKLFDEIKKDYGLQGVELKKAGRINLGRNVEGGAMTDQTATSVTVYLDSIENEVGISPKESLFEKLCHELCHARQNRILYRADKERLINILANRAPNELTKDCWNEILQHNENNKDMAVSFIKNKLGNLFEQKYSNLDNLPQKSATEIEALFHNKQHYKHAGTVPFEEYVAQPIEKEAYEISDLAQHLFGFLGIK